jgi:hypothetical protein
LRAKAAKAATILQQYTTAELVFLLVRKYGAGPGGRGEPPPQGAEEAQREAEERVEEEKGKEEEKEEEEGAETGATAAAAAAAATAATAATTTAAAAATAAGGQDLPQQPGLDGDEDESRAGLDGEDVKDVTQDQALADWLGALHSAFAAYAPPMLSYGYDDVQMLRGEEPAAFAAALKEIGVKKPHHRRLVRAHAELRAGLPAGLRA